MILLNDEQKSLADTIRQFGQTELDPKADRLDENEEFNEAAFRKLGKLGLLGILVDPKHGGAGMGTATTTLCMEKLAEHCASTTLSYLAHSVLCVNNISENASEEQKSRYLPKLISGEWIGGMGMTEPGSGSDMLNMQMKAEKTKNGYVLTGTKSFITNGPVGDVFVIYARTGSAKNQLSTFIVEKSFKGFSVGKKLKKFGMRASPTGELILEKCEVPEANRVGAESDSTTHIMRNLNVERITISGISLGLASASLNYTRKYLKERRQFGKALSEMEIIQHRLADLVTDLDAARAIVYLAAENYDSGQRELSLGAKAKLFSAQMATRVCLEGIQLLGGYGYTKEYPVERYMRDAKLMEIGAGTNEIMRYLIAREFLK